MAHERVQTSHAPVSSCQCGRFVGEQCPAQGHRTLPALCGFSASPTRFGRASGTGGSRLGSPGHPDPRSPCPLFV